MKRAAWGARAAVVCLLLALTIPVLAQEAGSDFVGTVTLRNGQSFSGVIKLAELGVVLGSGVGNLLPGYGQMNLQAGDQQVSIQARDIASIEADWGDGAASTVAASTTGVTSGSAATGASATTGAGASTLGTG